MRRHVEDLSSRGYPQNLPSTPDFVVMAIPDFALLPAVQQDPDLIDRALQKDVVLATFSTLVALLRCIDRGWQEKRSIDQVREIVECGRILHDRLRVFAGHFEDIGKELGQAVNKYNEGVGSFNLRLLVQAQRFSELGVPTTRELPNLRTIESSIQPLRDYSSEAEEE
jgi:DNA recombination protein RmuC